MNHSVTINGLPEGFTFPPELDARIQYDATRRTLSWPGFMSKADFDRLGRLHDDWGYRRSLEELFRLCTVEPEPRPTNRLAMVFARLLPRRDPAGA